jgi:uncharacterized membrane protein
MNLPAISLPKIDLPFDLPVLLHPPVDHFAIALPIVVLLIEFINIFIKKRSFSVLSLFLVIAMVIAAISAYLTGSVDGKEAYPLLNEMGQSELKEHKLLGTYIMLFSAVVLLFKLASMIMSSGLAKAFYLLILALFVAGVLKQGKDGGELVYEFGANVEMVKTLDDERFDLEEERDELKEELETATKELEVQKSKASEQVNTATDANASASETASSTEN